MMKIYEIVSEGSPSNDFNKWKERHKDATIIDIKYQVHAQNEVLWSCILILYEEPEDLHLIDNLVKCGRKILDDQD